jgi:GNAT superfamily N-acetyltransferase
VQPSELAERDALRSLGNAPGVAFAEIGSAVAFSLPGLPDIRMVHHTVGLGEDEPADDAVLDQVASFFEGVGVRFYACVTPTAQPADLRDRIAARGFEHGYDWLKFTRDVEPPPFAATDLDVRLIGAEAGADFAALVLEAYGMPREGLDTVAAVPGLDGWSVYIAYDDDAPAAAGALFVSGRFGWLSFAGTLAEHRRKGGQSAVLEARIARARELGVTTLVTETGVVAEGRPSNSYRNILRTGFHEAYVPENYLSP